MVEEKSFDGMWETAGGSVRWGGGGDHETRGYLMKRGKSKREKKTALTRIPV